MSKVTTVVRCGICATAFLYGVTVYARDINLDAIYISKKSSASTQLIQSKLDMYSAVEATLADTGAAFAGWSSGDSVVYVKDFENSFEVSEYFPSTRVKRKIASVKGAVIYATTTRDGKYLFAKTLRSNGSSSPVNNLVIIQIGNGQIYEYSSKELFIDFSLSPFGSWLREGSEGIAEYQCDSSSSHVILAKTVYRGFLAGNQTAIPFLSPDSRRIAILSGGGGLYKGAVFENGTKRADLDGISSPSDFTWIDSSQIAYRAGSPGNYHLMIFSLIDKKVFSVGTNSFNTNLSYSPQNGLVSFLQDGCIAFYHTRNHSLEMYPVEGEDISFAPDGNRFCLLYGGRLLIVQRQKMKTKIIEMKRVAAQIAGIYRTLKNDKTSFETDFSEEYIRRKEDMYTKLSR